MILFLDTVGMSCWRNLILQQFKAILCISAEFVRTTMTYHSPPVMVAIGLLGDEAERNQSATTRWSPPTATATGVPASMQSERCGKGNAGVFSWRPMRDEIRSNLPPDIVDSKMRSPPDLVDRGHTSGRSRLVGR